MRHDYDDSSHRIFMQAFVIGQDIFSANNPKNASYKPPIQNAVTRVGNILRKMSLDELPQIFNVLKGEMSLIGPRPNVPWEVEKYQEWHYERLRVLPGITGLAQVRGRSSITFDSIVLNDIEYIEKRSLMLDLQILWWTILTVAGGRGAG
jgi:lipopolysaccharide/colanic/teichoic acid biosynthesis glycosyltransferase